MSSPRKKRKPPRIGSWLLKRLTEYHDSYSSLGDFEEEFHLIAEKRNALRASLWYWMQIGIAIPHYVSLIIYWRLSMFHNYLKIAYRHFKKYKAYSMINVIGLAIGMACCILMTLWITDELSYDRFHEHSDRLYRIITETELGDQINRLPQASYPLGPLLKEKYPEVVDYVLYTGGYTGWQIRYGDVVFANERIGFGGPSFFNMFSFPFIQGNPETALQERYTVILTETFARKVFGEQDPIGQVMQMSDTDMTVTGIVADIPANSHLQFDFIIPMINQERWREQEFDNWEMGSPCYIQLGEGVSSKAFEKKIAHIVNEYHDKGKTTIHLQSMTRVHLHSDFIWDMSNTGKGDINSVRIFSISAICILLIACMNFINLSTARSANRSKEVGLRKVIGARRHDIIKQFFNESTLMSILSLLLSLAMAYILLPTLNGFSGKALDLNFINNRSLLSGVIVIAIITGLASGSYPAVFLSSFHPLRVLRGGFSEKQQGQSLFRKALVVIQFGITIILLITTLIISRQLAFMQNKDLGFNKDHIVSFAGYGRYWGGFAEAKAELLNHPYILNVTKGFPPERMGRGNSDFQWEGKNAGAHIALYPTGVDFDYVETFGMEIVDGRSFSSAFATDSVNCILNEKAVEVMGLDSPVGTSISYSGNMGWAYGWDNRQGVVIGVVKNFHLGSLHHEIPPVVLKFSTRGFFVSVKLAADHIPEAMDFLEEKWGEWVPGEPFRYRFFDESIGNYYQSEKRIGKMFKYFTTLAILIACLGIFGMSSFIAEQRTKEIGIRKVMGASVSGVVLMLSKDFTKWVLAANIIAWPLAYFMMHRWLQNFAFRINLEAGTFILSTFVALVIALLTCSIQAVRAARANPVEVLKWE